MSLVAVYAESLVPEEIQYGLFVGDTDQLIYEMNRITTLADGTDFNPTTVAYIEDILLREGYAVTSAWVDEIEYWVAPVTSTR